MTINHVYLHPTSLVSFGGKLLNVSYVEYKKNHPCFVSCIYLIHINC